MAEDNMSETYDLFQEGRARLKRGMAISSKPKSVTSRSRSITQPPFDRVA